MSAQGSIKKDASGKWSFVVDLVGVGGKRKQAFRRGFATKKAAQAELNEAAQRAAARRVRRSDPFDTRSVHARRVVAGAPIVVAGVHGRQLRADDPHVRRADDR